MRSTSGNEGTGLEGPAPSVLPPTAALGLLPSRALSSGWASRRYTSESCQTSPFWIARKRKTLGGWGQSPQIATPLAGTAYPMMPASCVLRCNPQSHVPAEPVQMWA
jgi:hypothetical protein